MIAIVTKGVLENDMLLMERCVWLYKCNNEKLHLNDLTLLMDVTCNVKTNQVKMILVLMDFSLLVEHTLMPNT